VPAKDWQRFKDKPLALRRAGRRGRESPANALRPGDV
jgi:hypothetical protein